MLLPGGSIAFLQKYCMGEEMSFIKAFFSHGFLLPPVKAKCSISVRNISTLLVFEGFPEEMPERMLFFKGTQTKILVS